MSSDNRTADWKLFDAGKKYNNSLKPNYYDTVNTNIAFFNGDQWRNVRSNGMPTPVFNIIKRVITFFVASLTSSKVKLQLEPLLYADENPTPDMQRELSGSEIANAEINNLFEKFKMEFRVRDACFDAAITGDAVAHFYFDPSKKPYGGAYSGIKGEIVMELIDGNNVYFGNANNPNVEIQPYIIIDGRDMVQNLQEEAKRYKQFAKESNSIQSDSDYQGQAGDAGKIEVEADDYGKAHYIIIYRKDKKTGTIKASKCVEKAYIYKDVDTGMTHYPIAFMNWEKQKNQYHGRAICTGIIPNQVFINKMFAMVMYHLMMTAFPKAVYDADKISNWTNEIGTAIPLRNLSPGESIKNVAGYLEPGNMSNQIVQAIEMAMSYTKETLGISDATLGNIDPKNTSAIIAVQKSSIVPLENPRANLFEWIEDIGRILIDMMGTYYGLRPIVMERDNVKVLEEFDFSKLKDMWLNVRADVGESSYWSEIASIQTLDRLLEGGYLEIADYLERIPDGYIPRKQELIDKLKEQAELQQIQSDQVNKILSMLPPDLAEGIMAQLQAEQQQPTPIM